MRPITPIAAPILLIHAAVSGFTPFLFNRAGDTVTLIYDPYLEYGHERPLRQGCFFALVPGKGIDSAREENPHGIDDGSCGQGLRLFTEKGAIPLRIRYGRVSRSDGCTEGPVYEVIHHPIGPGLFVSNWPGKGIFTPAKPIRSPGKMIPLREAEPDSAWRILKRKVFRMPGSGGDLLVLLEGTAYFQSRDEDKFGTSGILPQRQLWLIRSGSSILLVKEDQYALAYGDIPAEPLGFMDVNADGLPDILMGNAGEGAVGGVLESQGDTFIGRAFPMPPVGGC